MRQSLATPAALRDALHQELQQQKARIDAWLDLLPRLRDEQGRPWQPTQLRTELAAIRAQLAALERCQRAEFHAQGHRVGRQRLRTALRRLGLRALQPKAYVPRTTDSAHGQRCAPNLLLEQAPPTQANQVWVSDSTCLPLASGNWVYLCALQDSVTRQVVGWHVMATMPEELLTTALRRALLARQPAPGLLVHADRGGQYIGQAYSCWQMRARNGRRAARPNA